MHCESFGFDVTLAEFCESGVQHYGLCAWIREVDLRLQRIISTRLLPVALLTQSDPDNVRRSHPKRHFISDIVLGHTCRARAFAAIGITCLRRKTNQRWPQRLWVGLVQFAGDRGNIHKLNRTRLRRLLPICFEFVLVPTLVDIESHYSGRQHSSENV